MAEIIPIRENAPIPTLPNAEVISILRRYLEQAERGEIDAVAIAVSRPNDTISSSYEFGLASFRLCGAVMFLHSEIVACLKDISKEVFSEGPGAA